MTDAPAAPAAIVKTCRREIPCDPVMTRRPSVRDYQLTSVNRFVLRRLNRAQTRLGVETASLNPVRTHVAAYEIGRTRAVVIPTVDIPTVDHEPCFMLHGSWLHG
jgi:hypothetical protein